MMQMQVGLATVRGIAAAVVCSLSMCAAVTLASQDATVPEHASGQWTFHLSPEITRADLRAHVEELASDAMQGRATGTAGGERAEQYLAHAFEAVGLEPGGDQGTFLQAVRLQRTRASGEPELVLRTQSGEELRPVHGRDYTVAIQRAALENVPIRVVREASGVAADPKWNAAVFIDSTSKNRERWLADAGHPRGAGIALLVQAGSATEGSAAAVGRERSGLVRTSAVETAAPPWIRLRGPLVERLKRGELASVSLHFEVEEDVVTAHNVIGVLRGVDRTGGPAVAGEAIVISAHHDHLGLRAMRGGSERRAETSTPAPAVDDVFNGADDDASGCAAVLELAGALAAEPKPARTLVFLLATGEEIGLLGTEEYLDHPLVPLDHTALNLNFEMIGRPDEKLVGAGAMWLTGYELTNLGPAFAKEGLPVRADPRPEEHFFERSDNYAFVRRGVVGQTLSTFDLHTDYHSVDDESDRIDYEHMEACVRVAMRALRPLADGTLRPSWLETKAPPTRAR